MEKQPGAKLKLLFHDMGLTQIGFLQLFFEKAKEKSLTKLSYDGCIGPEIPLKNINSNNPAITVEGMKYWCVALKRPVSKAHEMIYFWLNM